jgi:hypothetical protein
MRSSATGRPIWRKRTGAPERTRKAADNQTPASSVRYSPPAGRQKPATAHAAAPVGVKLTPLGDAPGGFAKYRVEAG